MEFTWGKIESHEKLTSTINLFHCHSCLRYGSYSNPFYTFKTNQQITLYDCILYSQVFVKFPTFISTINSIKEWFGWFRMTLDDFGWLRITLDNFGWLRMTSDDFGWLWKTLDDFGWLRMTLDDFDEFDEFNDQSVAH